MFFGIEVLYLLKQPFAVHFSSVWTSRKEEGDISMKEVKTNIRVENDNFEGSDAWLTKLLSKQSKGKSYSPEGVELNGMSPTLTESGTCYQETT